VTEGASFRGQVSWKDQKVGKGRTSFQKQKNKKIRSALNGRVEVKKN